MLGLRRVFPANSDDQPQAIPVHFFFLQLRCLSSIASFLLFVFKPLDQQCLGKQPVHCEKSNKLPTYIYYTTKCRDSSWTAVIPPPHCGAAAQSGPWSPQSWGFLITHNYTSQSVGLPWTSDQLVAETSTWQNTTFTADIHPSPRRDSNPQSQRAIGLRPTP